MVQFKKFSLYELFDEHVDRGTRLTRANRVLGDYPLATAGEQNTGVSDWIVENKQLFPANSITIDMFGNVFYRSYDYYADDNILVLHSDNWPKEVMLYISAQINHVLKGRFDYSRQFRQKVLRDVDIELPVTPAGELDFEYMTMRIRELEAERIRELEAERIRELEAYLRVTGLDDTTLSASEAQALTQKVQWKKFRINNFFKVLPVKHKLIKRELLSCGQYPCYSSDTSNYGILGYTNNPEFHIDDKHSYLIFGDHTRSMRIVESDFSVLDNVKVLCGRKLSKEKLLFIETMWHKAIPNLGYARHWSVAKNVDFLLPVTSTGDIDFNYMQNYIRATEKKTIKGVVEYKDRIIEETKKVVNG